MSRKMFVPFHGDGIISQFEGYEDLEELDWDAYRAKYGNIQRLDRILRAEGDDPDRYKLAKQADTVMLFFLFPDEELRRLFERLGYEYAPDTARKTIDYYDQRTSHGSTLSFITHAAVLAALDPESSWERFLVALESDVGDVQGGTTKEGIHMGVMSGTLDLDPARLHGQRHPRRGPVLRPASDGSARRALVPDAVPRHADPGELCRRGELTVAAAVRGLQPADHGSAWATTSASLCAGERACSRLAAEPKGAQMATGFQGAIFDVDGVLVDSPHEEAWREALRELMETQWSDIRDESSCAPERFTPQVYQQVMSGQAADAAARRRRSSTSAFPTPSAGRATTATASRRWSSSSSSQGEFTAYPDALRFLSR